METWRDSNMQQPPERLTTPGQLLGTLQLAPCLCFSQNRKERERERERGREGGREGWSEWARAHTQTYKQRHIRRRKFGSQTSDNMDRWKNRGGKNQRREGKKREDEGRERAIRKKCRCVKAKSQNTVFFQWFVAPGSKSRLAKAAGAEPCGRMRDEKLHAVVARRALLEVEMSKKWTPLWREAHVQVKMYKAHHAQSIFGSWDVEKVHPVVARSTFPSQNVQNTPCSEHFWKLRCRKSARRCGAKHISWKQSYSANFPQFLNLTTSKTKQFRETSSIFQVDNIKNEEILRGFLQKWKVECRADGLVPMRFAIFPLHLFKVLRLPRKSEARFYKVLHLSHKIIFPKLKIWSSKMQPLSGNLRPDLLTSLMNMSLVLRLPRKMPLSRASSNVPRLPWFLDMLENPDVLLTFDKVYNPLCRPRQTTSR